MILIIVLYMLLASTFTIGKAVLQYADPIFFIGVRMILAGLLLLGYTYFFNRTHWQWPKKEWWLFVQLTLFHIYFSFVLEFIALKSVTSAKACLVYSLSPFLTALFSYVLFHDRLTPKKWTGLMIGCLGLLPIIMESAPGEGAAFMSLSIAELLLIGSVISSVYGWMLMKTLVSVRHYAPTMANGVSMLFGGFGALVTSYVYEGVPALHGSGPLVWGFQVSRLGMFMVYLILAIIIANIIFYNLYGYLLRHYSATFLSFAGFTSPLFAALYGWMLLGETVSYRFFASVAVIGVGLYLFYQEELKKQTIV